MLVGVFSYVERVEGGCGTYVMVAGKSVVHELLPYQPEWRVLNEPQMRQLLVYRWSVELEYFPPCDDCRCDGRTPVDPAPPTTLPSPRDNPPATGFSTNSQRFAHNAARMKSSGNSSRALAGFPMRLDRPPELM
jgi:hypothetical protein